MLQVGGSLQWSVSLVNCSGCAMQQEQGCELQQFCQHPGRSLRGYLPWTGMGSVSRDGTGATGRVQFAGHEVMTAAVHEVCQWAAACGLDPALLPLSH
jgi:hypothetical protein